MQNGLNPLLPTCERLAKQENDWPEEPTDPRDIEEITEKQPTPSSSTCTNQASIGSESFVPVTQKRAQFQARTSRRLTSRTKRRASLRARHRLGSSPSFPSTSMWPDASKTSSFAAPQAMTASIKRPATPPWRRAAKSSARRFSATRPSGFSGNPLPVRAALRAEPV